MHRRVVNVSMAAMTAAFLSFLNIGCLGPFLIPPSSFKDPLTCPVHDEHTEQAWVPIRYGFPAAAYPREAQYRKLYFPCANQSVVGGCSPTPAKVALVRYCDECRATEDDWKERMGELKEPQTILQFAIRHGARPCPLHGSELLVGTATVYGGMPSGMPGDFEYTEAKLFPLANTELSSGYCETMPYETPTRYCPDCRVAQEEWKRAGKPLMKGPYPRSLGALLNRTPK